MKTGELYHIIFWDHSIKLGKPIYSEVVGWVIPNNEENNCPKGKHVTLTYWKTDTGNSEDDKENQEPVTILKSVIIKARKIKS